MNVILSLRNSPMIELQQSTQPLSALDVPFTACFRCRFRDNDVVTDALVIPFYMVMGGVLLEYMAKRRLAEEYQGQNFTRLRYVVRTYHPGAKDTLVEICSHFSDATILVQNIQGVFGCSK